MSRAAAFARRFTETKGLDAQTGARLALVVEELVANLIEHGGPHGAARIVVRLRRLEGRIAIGLSDAGRPFDPRTVAFAGPNRRRGGGAGLALVASLCEITAYERRGGRNQLMLEMSLD